MPVSSRHCPVGRQRLELRRSFVVSATARCQSSLCLCSSICASRHIDFLSLSGGAGAGVGSGAPGGEAGGASWLYIDRDGDESQRNTAVRRSA